MPDSTPRRTDGAPSAARPDLPTTPDHDPPPLTAQLERLRRAAQRSGQYAGRHAHEFAGPDGLFTTTFRGTPTWARATVLKLVGATIVETTHVASREEHGAHDDHHPTGQEAEPSQTTLGDHAEIAALRCAFPLDHDGVDDTDEPTNVAADPPATTLPDPARNRYLQALWSAVRGLEQHAHAGEPKAAELLVRMGRAVCATSRAPAPETLAADEVRTLLAAQLGALPTSALEELSGGAEKALRIVDQRHASR